jgi:hypothetical protein
VKLGRQDGETPGELCCLFLQLFDVSHQLIFVGKAAKVEADHFVRPLRVWHLSALPESGLAARTQRKWGSGVNRIPIGSSRE